MHELHELTVTIRDASILHELKVVSSVLGVTPEQVALQSLDAGMQTLLREWHENTAPRREDMFRR